MSQHDNNCPCTFCWNNKQIAALESSNGELLAALEALHSANVDYFRDFEHLHPAIAGPMVMAVRALAKVRSA